MIPYPYDKSSQTFRNNEHNHKFLRVSIIAVIVLIIFSGLYWWSTSITNNSNQPTVVDEQAMIRAQVAETLRNSTVKVSQQQIDQVAAQLSASKVTVSDA